MPEEEPRILNRVCCAEERITELERTIAALRALVEAKDKVLTAGATNKLRMLAGWIDLKYPNDSDPEVQQDLRRWADSIDTARALTEGEIRKRLEEK